MCKILSKNWKIEIVNFNNQIVFLLFNLLLTIELQEFFSTDFQIVINRKIN